MSVKISDIADLVEVTVRDLGSSKPVHADGGNIMIGSTPIPIDEVMAATHSTKAFLPLIKKAL